MNDLEITTGKLHTYGYFYGVWTDEQLTWNVTSFNGLTYITLTSDDIWTPYFAQYDGSDVDVVSSNIWVFADGQVTWLVANNLRGFCKLNIFRYPFDVHECAIHAISVKHYATEIELIAITAQDIHAYGEHGEWELISCDLNVLSITEAITELPVLYFEKRLTYRRRYLFTLVHHIIPLYILYMTATVIFVVPLDSGERISFAMAVLLAFVFLTSTLSEELPRSSLTTSCYSLATSIVNVVTAFDVIASVALCNMIRKTHPVTGVLKHLTIRCQLYKKKATNKVTSIDPSVKIDKQTKRKEEQLTSVDVMLNKGEAPRITWSDTAHMLDSILFYINLALFFILTFVLITLSLV